MKFTVRFTSLKRGGLFALIFILVGPLFSMLESWLNSRGIFFFPFAKEMMQNLYTIAFWCIIFIGIRGFITNCALDDKIKNIVKNILTFVFCLWSIVLIAATFYLAYLDIPKQKTTDGYYIMYEETDGVGDIIIDGQDMKVYFAKPHGPFTMTKIERNKKFSYESFETMKEEAYRAIYDKYYKDKKYSYSIDYNAKGYSRLKLHEDEKSIEFLMYDETSGSNVNRYFIHYSYIKDESGLWDVLNADTVATYIYNTESKIAYSCN